LLLGEKLPDGTLADSRYFVSLNRVIDQCMVIHSTVTAEPSKPSAIVESNGWLMVLLLA
jgi:hypothetical protein